MAYKIFYIASVAIGIEEDGGRIISFSMPNEPLIPKEFQVGDEVEISNHPSHPAIIGMGHNLGYYEIIHLASGKSLKTFHIDDEWRIK